MSTNSPKEPEDKEINLSEISRGIGSGFQKFNTFLYHCIRFFVRNIIIIAILTGIGVGAGMFLDRNKVYDHQMIVMPNFESADYAYAKIDLLNAKISNRDTVFLKEVVGIKEPRKLMKISIRPILDPYKFLNVNDLNYKVFELLSTDSDADKAIAANVTSRNYLYHMITLKTVGKTSEGKLVTPILNYLNSSPYFAKIQKIYIENTKTKIEENNTIIAQIDGILNQFSKAGTTGTNGNLIYNENSQLNDLIDSKDKLIRERGNLRIYLSNIDQTIKKHSVNLNARDMDSTKGKMKYILPLVFIIAFILLYRFRIFYKNQSLKDK